MDKVFVTIAEFLDKYISKGWVVFIISLLPILEIRGGLIAAHFLDVDWIRAFILCFIANIIPVVFILLFVEKILRWMKNTKLFAKLAGKIEKRADKKQKEIDDPWILRTMLKTKGFRKMGERIKTEPQYKEMILLRCKMFALFLFVAIPLPGTGAWTGSVIAALMNMKVRYAFPVIALGVLIAGFIMTLLTYGLLASLGI